MATAISFRACHSTSKQASVLGILGRNGVGKTTMLQSILGLPTPRSGDIRFKDKVISRASDLCDYAGGHGLGAARAPDLPKPDRDGRPVAGSPARASGPLESLNASLRCFRFSRNAQAPVRVRFRVASSKCLRSGVRLLQPRADPDGRAVGRIKPANRRRGR